MKPLLGSRQLVIYFERSQLSIDGVQERVSSSSRSSSIDGDHNHVVIRRQIMIPVQLPLVGHFLRSRPVVNLEQSWIFQNLAMGDGKNKNKVRNNFEVNNDQMINKRSPTDIWGFKANSIFMMRVKS